MIGRFSAKLLSSRSASSSAYLHGKCFVPCDILDVIATVTQFAATTARVIEKTLSAKPLPLAEYRNFLLVQHPLALGTAIHTTPIIPALHAVVPGARIAAVASGFAHQILIGNPGLERLIASPSPLKEFPSAVRAWRSANVFSGEPYVVLHPIGNERTLIYAAAMLTGGHIRVGYAVLPELAFASIHFDPRLSQIANNLRLLDVLGHGPSLVQVLERQPEVLEPQVFPSEKDRIAASNLLVEKGIDPSRPIAIFVTQTSPTQRKSWRPERFRAVAEYLHKRYNMQIVFAGTKAESPAIENIRDQLTFASASVAGQTSLLELAALMGLADVALTLDTGPMHLLRAMRTPMVILAPAWSPPIEWLPLNNPRARILKNADMPEPLPDYIIDEVSVEEAIENLDDLLALYPPREFSQRV